MASVSQALDSLLPSRTHPPKLTSLANSLLAQSRLRAPNLKAEEEIARPYACAEIACSRLRVQLRLPASLKGRPPCKPGVYKKLIGFLKDVLIEQKDVPEQTISTPKKRMANGAVKGTTSTATTPASTPKRKDDFVGKVRAGERGQKEGEAPEWVMPLESYARLSQRHSFHRMCTLASVLCSNWRKYGLMDRVGKAPASSPATPPRLSLQYIYLYWRGCKMVICRQTRTLGGTGELLRLRSLVRRQKERRWWRDGLRSWIGRDGVRSRTGGEMSQRA
jgi:origin recognition complex subunit 6